MAQRDPKRRATTAAVRDELSRSGDLPADPAEAHAIIDAEVRRRVLRSGRCSQSGGLRSGEGGARSSALSGTGWTTIIVALSARRCTPSPKQLRVRSYLNGPDGSEVCRGTAFHHSKDFTDSLKRCF